MNPTALTRVNEGSQVKPYRGWFVHDPRKKALLAPIAWLGCGAIMLALWPFLGFHSSIAIWLLVCIPTTIVALWNPPGWSWAATKVFPIPPAIAWDSIVGHMKREGIDYKSSEGSVPPFVESTASGIDVPIWRVRIWIEP